MIREFFIITLLTAIGSTFSLYHGWAPLPWGGPEIVAGEIRLEDALAIDVIWLDARPLKAYKHSHIPDAIFFDENDWSGAVHALMNNWLNQAKPIVIYCGGENCDTSKRIADRLRESMPDAEIYNLKGGWEAWQK